MILYDNRQFNYLVYPYQVEFESILTKRLAELSQVNRNFSR